MAEEKQPFVVNGKEYPVPDEFTMGEMCDAEQYFGVQFGENMKSSMRLIAATLYIAIKRVDPSITVDDIRALPPDALQQANEVKADPPSMPEPDDGSSDSSASSGDRSLNGGVDPDVVPSLTGLES